MAFRTLLLVTMLACAVTSASAASICNTKLQTIKKNPEEAVKALRKLRYSERVARQLVSMRPDIVRRILAKDWLVEKADLIANATPFLVNAKTQKQGVRALTLYRGLSIPDADGSKLILVMPKDPNFQPSLDESDFTYTTNSYSQGEHYARWGYDEGFLITLEVPPQLTYYGGEPEEFVLSNAHAFERSSSVEEITDILRRQRGESEEWIQERVKAPRLYDFTRVYDIRPYIYSITNVNTGEEYSLKEFIQKFQTP